MYVLSFSGFGAPLRIGMDYLTLYLAKGLFLTGGRVGTVRGGACLMSSIGKKGNCFPEEQVSHRSGRLFGGFNLNALSGSARSTASSI